MNTDPHLYTCSYNKQWLNGVETKGVYATTVISPYTPTVFNFVILFSINTNNIISPRWVEFNHFSLLITQTYQHEDGYYVYNTDDDDDCEEYDDYM